MTDEEFDRELRATPLTPCEYMNPFQELTAAAARFDDFDNGDPQLMREALGNIRSIKQRTIDALNGISRIFKKHTDEKSCDEVYLFQDALILLTELANDMDFIERKITDRMIEERSAA